MSASKAEQAPATLAGALPSALSEPSDLAVAVRVGQYMLATYGSVDHGDVFALNQAYGAVTESLRILLRALGAEPEVCDSVAERRNAEADSRSEGWTATMAVRLPGPRCPAAHPDDPTPCDGPPVVTVLDATNAGADGCEHHAARLLASLDRGRVYGLPDVPAGAAIHVFKAADGIRPFAWTERGENQ